MRARDRSEIEDPKLTMVNTDTAEPHRAPLRMDNDEPKCRASSKLMLADTRATPSSEAPDPQRAPARMLSVDPSCAKSNAESEPPVRRPLLSDIEDPSDT
jgi:hypothetical protein